MNAPNLNQATVAVENSYPQSEQANEFAYKTVSKAAVASLSFAILGFASYLASAFVLLPLLAFGLGIVGIANINKFPEELTGKKLAQFGLAVGGFCLVTSIAMHSIIYATEVPEGYQRISYGELRNNNRTAVPYSEKAEDFDGKKVFLKGYVRPGLKKRKLKEFILVGDFGSCCFGGNPKPTEVVAIRIVDKDKTVDYGYGLRRIGGTFHLNRRAKLSQDEDIPGIYYEIEADHVR